MRRMPVRSTGRSRLDALRHQLDAGFTADKLRVRLREPPRQECAAALSIHVTLIPGALSHRTNRSRLGRHQERRRKQARTIPASRTFGGTAWRGVGLRAGVSPIVGPKAFRLRTVPSAHRGTS
jgi:hypothetical protein